MKKLLLLSAFLFGFTSAQAQYLSTAVNGRQWYVSYQGWFTGTTIYEVGPKVNYQGGQHPLILIKDANFVLQDTLGVLVEDTFSGTVTINYLNMDPATNRDSSFTYSFSHSVGDTFSYTVLDGSQITLTVDSTYSYQDFKGVTRRVLRYKVPAQANSSETFFEVIEGIGPTTGWANPVYDGTFTDFPLMNLRCVLDGSLKIYGENSTSCILLSQAENKLTPVALYPNPAKDKLYLKGEQVFSHYAIVNLAGQVVQQRKITQGPLDVTTLKAGLYILQLFGPDSNRGQQKFRKR
jgi:hypothetical protein